MDLYKPLYGVYTLNIPLNYYKVAYKQGDVGFYYEIYHFKVGTALTVTVTQAKQAN